MGLNFGLEGFDSQFGWIPVRVFFLQRLLEQNQPERDKTLFDSAWESSDLLAPFLL